MTATETVTVSPEKPAAGRAYRRIGDGSGVVEVGGDLNVVGAAADVVGSTVVVVRIAVGAAVDVVRAVTDKVDAVITATVEVDRLNKEIELVDSDVALVDVEDAGSGIHVLLASTDGVDNVNANVVNVVVSDLIVSGTSVDVVGVAVGDE